LSTKIIYHQIKQGVNCPDGYAAAWVAHLAHPEAEVVGCWYQCEEKDLPVFSTGDLAIIVDFSFPSDILQKWSELGVQILLIDHHKTAMEHLGDISKFSEHFDRKILFDMEECGATLTWKYFFPEKQIPLFLQYVKDRDLWTKSLPGSDAVHEVIAKLGRSFDLYDLLLEYRQEFMVLAELGEVLLLPKKRQIAEIVKRAKLIGFYGYENIPCVGLDDDGSEDRLVSDICEELYKNQYPESLFVVCLTSDSTWSLRSNKDNIGGGFDVGNLAKLHGGGGHKNASGFKKGEKP
jgi:uncharacterized protein